MSSLNIIYPDNINAERFLLDPMMVVVIAMYYDVMALRYLVNSMKYPKMKG